MALNTFLEFFVFCHLVHAVQSQDCKLFQSQPEDNTVLEGTVVQLPCVFDGHTGVSWKKENTSITSGVSCYCTVNSVGTLVFYNVTFEDSASYTCNAPDVRGFVRRCVAKLTVVHQSIDECSSGIAKCDDHAECTNTPDSYTCTCNGGYTGTGFICNDINECENGSSSCDKNAECTNTKGGYNCTCPNGLSGNGQTCHEDSGGEENDEALFVTIVIILLGALTVAGSLAIFICLREKICHRYANLIRTAYSKSNNLQTRDNKTSDTSSITGENGKVIETTENKAYQLMAVQLEQRESVTTCNNDIYYSIIPSGNNTTTNHGTTSDSDINATSARDTCEADLTATACTSSNTIKTCPTPEIIETLV